MKAPSGSGERAGGGERQPDQALVERVGMAHQTALAEVLAVVGGDDHDRLLEDPALLEAFEHAAEPVVEQPHGRRVQPPHPLERRRGHVEAAGAGAPDLAHRQVPARLDRGPGAVERAERVVGPRRQVGRVRLDEVDEARKKGRSSPPPSSRKPPSAVPASAAPSSTRARMPSPSQLSRARRSVSLISACRRVSIAAKLSKPISKPVRGPIQRFELTAPVR